MMVGFKLHLEREILLQKKILVKLIFFFQRGGQPKGKENEIDGPVWETTFNGQDYCNVNSSRKHSGV